MTAIETMTLAAMLRAGIAPDRVAALVRLALDGNVRAARTLERAVAGEISVTLPRIDEPCPLRHVDALRRRRGILFARVPLGPGLYWEDDALHGDMPDQLRTACIGRPLSDVVGSDGVRPDAVIRETKTGLFGVERMVESMPSPSFADLVRTRVDLLRMLIEDGRMDVKPSRAILAGSAAMAALVSFVALWRWTWPAEDPAGSFSLWALTLAAAYNVWVAVNLRTRRPFSLIYAAMADARHRGRYRID